MKSTIRFAASFPAAALFCSLLLVSCPAALADGPAVGSIFPDIAFAVPEKAEDQRYLKLTGKETFTVQQIPVPVVIVQIFSMYCPHCQKDAPRTNELFKKLSDHPKLKDAVRLIGIGVGNSAYEVAFFRKTYNIPFPLLPDGDFAVHKRIGEVRTPHFIVVKNTPKGPEILYSKSGAIPNLDEFVDWVVRKTE